MAKIISKIVLILNFISATVFAGPLKLPAVFSDNMILQRGQKNPIWGEALPNSMVKIELNHQIIKTQSDNQGKWNAHLPKTELYRKYNLTISNNSDTIVFSNIIAGDVYYAGGQSNMQFKLPKSEGGEDALRTSANNKIRFFNVPHAVAYTPQPDITKSACETPIDGHWVCSDSINAMHFSAVAYYFARKIYQQTKVPVGIINVSWGGTPIEAHSSPNVNAYFPDFEKQLELMRTKSVSDTLKINTKKETPQLPSSIYNAMIHPLIPYGLKGVLWYQGEHNWNFPIRYEKQLTAFINDFRLKWNNKNLPFMVVQLPGIGLRDTVFRDYYWAFLRESQKKAVKNTRSNLCVTIDLGGDGNLHPANKMEVGERLAKIALKKLYHKNVPSVYTRLTKYDIKNEKIILSFSNKIIQKNLNTFSGVTICGNDRIFKNAEIQFDGRRVIVWNTEISNPVAVRYAWGGNPVALLFDKNNMPVCPFRTDNFETRKDGSW